MESWPYTACWAAWLGKREGVRLIELLVEGAKAFRKIQHGSQLHSCVEMLKTSCLVCKPSLFSKERAKKIKKCYFSTLILQ
jgi:hypothetical protein